MKTDDYTYSTFIPKEFSIGINGSMLGFPSMRLKNGSWTNASVFEKHCGGYKPYVQRDAQKEIMKDLHQVVQKVDNVPTEGFKLVSLRGIRYMSELYRYTALVALHDPRGWDVCINVDAFWSLLAKNGINIQDGVLAGMKLVYSWPANGRGAPFSLAAADEEAEKIKAATSRHIASIDCTSFIKPSQYRAGEVYSSTVSKLAGHKYMYIGIYDVYSPDAQLAAVMRKDYSGLPALEKDHRDVTGRKHVFYCLDRAAFGSHSIMDPGRSPYCVVSSLSKLFEKTGCASLADYRMHNDKSRAVSLENVKADMETSALFNKISLSRASSKTELADVDFQLFKDIFGSRGLNANVDETASKAFPFTVHTYGMFLRGNCYTAFSVDAVNPLLGRTSGSYRIQESKATGDYDYYHRREIAEHKFNSKEESEEVLKMIHGKYQPKVIQYYFENGKAVPPYQNLMLNRRTSC